MAWGRAKDEQRHAGVRTADSKLLRDRLGGTRARVVICGVLVGQLLSQGGCKSSVAPGSTPTTMTPSRPPGDIIPAERRAARNSDIPGGVPARTIVCASIDAAAYGDGSADATVGIQAALDGCLDQHVPELRGGRPQRFPPDYAAHRTARGQRIVQPDGDNTWGSGIYITILRNSLTGKRRSLPPLLLGDLGNRRASGLAEGHWWYTFIGTCSVRRARALRCIPPSPTKTSNCPGPTPDSHVATRV
jgi:hypothetical protein